MIVNWLDMYEVVPFPYKPTSLFSHFDTFFHLDT